MTSWHEKWVRPSIHDQSNIEKWTAPTVSRTLVWTLDLLSNFDSALALSIWPTYRLLQLNVRWNCSSQELHFFSSALAIEFPNITSEGSHALSPSRPKRSNMVKDLSVVPKPSWWWIDVLFFPVVGSCIWGSIVAAIQYGWQHIFSSWTWHHPRWKLSN